MSLFFSNPGRPWPPAVAKRFSRWNLFPGLARSKAFLLIHPGFGISTPWAYQNLARFPATYATVAPGRARQLVDTAANRRLVQKASTGCHHSLEAPALEKVSGARIVSGISPRQRRAGHAHVRQRLNHVCHRGKCQRRVNRS